MGASVTLVDDLFDDARAQYLAELLGETIYSVVGRLAFAWRQGTKQGKRALPEALVARHVDVAKLIESGLATRTRAGLIDFKGGDRLLWLKKRRDGGRENGHKGAEFGKLGGRPRKTPSKPGEGVFENRVRGLDQNPPSVSVSVSATAPVQEKKKGPTAPRPPRAAVVMPEGWEPDTTCSELARSLGLSLDLEAADFRDWTAQRPHRYADWQAAFRSHLRRRSNSAARGAPLPFARAPAIGSSAHRTIEPRRPEQ